MLARSILKYYLRNDKLVKQGKCTFYYKCSYVTTVKRLDELEMRRVTDNNIVWYKLGSAMVRLPNHTFFHFRKTFK